MTVYIIGTGTDGAGTLTRDAQAAIDRARLLIGAGRMLAPYENQGRQTRCLYQAEQIAQALRESDADPAAVLLSGDIGFFSGARRVLPLLGGMEVHCIPGISSAAGFCARLGVSYEDMHFVSLHGRESAVALPVRTHARCFFLLGGDMTAGAVCRRLCQFGLAEVTVHIGERLGYADESCRSGTAAEFREYEGDRLAVLVTENPAYLPYLPTSIPDAAFLRGSIPMTKSVVRGAAVSALQIGQNAVCWDIGCGTGSVSVEMAYRCPAGTVHAFDRNPDAVRLTRDNAERFSCDNILVSEGICPDILAAAPAPDCVFVGGSAGAMTEIFRCIHAKNPAARIAVTAVSLETLHEAAACFSRFHAEYGITQIAVTQTRQIGSHTMMQAENPVFLIQGRLS